MKIVDRKTFLQMPAGTVYCQAEMPFSWEGIRIKHDTCHFQTEDLAGDWFESTLTDIDADDSDDLYDRWQDMLDNGASYAIDLETICRDGLFMENSIFMVYEREDLEKLRDLFAKLAEGRSIE